MDKNGRAVEVPKGEREELLQMEEGQMASMIIVDGQAGTNHFVCSVEHEGGVVDTRGAWWTPGREN